MSAFAPARLARFALAFVVTAALAAGGAFAQAGKPIRILVGFPAGGGTDAIARTLADKLKDELDTSVVVENRAGAGGQIAAQAFLTPAPTLAQRIVRAKAKIRDARIP